MLALMSVCCLVACKNEVENEASPAMSYGVSASGIQMIVSASEQTIDSSETLELSVRVRHQQGIQLSWPDVPVIWGDFEVMEHHTTAAALDQNGGVVTTRIYTLVPDITGSAVLPGYSLQYKGLAGNTQYLNTEAITVTVRSVLPVADKTELRGIAPDQRDADRGSRRLWPMMLLIANVILVVVILWIWKQWRNPVSHKSNHAMNRLANLSGENKLNLQSQLEVAVVQALSEIHGLTPSTEDFTGLTEQLREKGISIPGLPDALRIYEQLQYNQDDADDSEWQTLHELFNVVIGQSAEGDAL